MKKNIKLGIRKDIKLVSKKNITLGAKNNINSVIKKNITLKRKKKTKDIKPKIKDIKSRIRDRILNNNLKNNLNYFKFKTTSKSLYKIDNNTASIYYQSLGKNTFITVLLRDKLIFNKSIGHIKLSGNIVKKKEKRRTKNIFGFSQYFTKVFFNELVEKYNIGSIKIYYNCLPENVYPLKKHFIYKLYGRILFKNRMNRRIANYLKRRKQKRLRKKNREERLRKKYKNFYKKKSTRKYKKKVKFKYIKNAYFNAWKKKLLKENLLVNIKSINFINKFPYNGCKHKKKKKI